MDILAYAKLGMSVEAFFEAVRHSLGAVTIKQYGSPRAAVECSVECSVDGQGKPYIWPCAYEKDGYWLREQLGDMLLALARELMMAKRANQP